MVFIQFNAQPVAGVADPGRVEYVPLAARHVDTGMGFERSTAIIQGTKNFADFSGIVSNYETDIFRPIFDEIEKLSGKKYASTLPKKDSGFGSAGVPAAGEGVSHSRTSAGESLSRRDTATNDRDGRATQIQIDIAFRVIADHIRTLSFAIADGIIPSNEGRGYVLRRILRRAVRYGRTLDFHEPFFFKLVDVVAKTMGDVFPEIRAKQKTIEETIRREEESFNKTLDQGLSQFNSMLATTLIPRLSHFFLNRDVTYEIVNRSRNFRVTNDPAGRNRGKRPPDFVFDVETNLASVFKKIGFTAELPGSFAFELYDTYGFPLDLTELMARERGFTVDVAGFEKLMEEQRARARAAQKKSAITVQHIVDFPTKFVGYKRC